MIYISTIILFITLLFPIYLGLKRRVSLFNPHIIVFFINFIFVFPYFLFLVFDKTLLNTHLYSILELSDNGLDYYLIYFSVLYSISMLCLYLGLNTKIKLNYSVKTLDNMKVYRVFSFIFLILGIFFYLKFMSAVGGITYFLNNIESRASFTSGNGYLQGLFSTFLTTSLTLMIFSYRKKSDVLLILPLSILLFIVFSSLGGRKSAIILTILIFLVWNFAVKEIKKVNKYVYLLIPVFILYILIVPLLRKKDAIEYYLNSKGELFQDVFNNFSLIFKELSYIDHYIFILYKFDINNLWLGSSFKDLSLAMLPSKSFPMKPPIDDGVYVRTMLEYNSYMLPGVPFKELYPSSWPPETFGNLYMNFWIPGVFIGFYLLGVIYKISYDFASYRKDYLAVSIYFSIIFGFHFSNLRIVQTFSDLFVYLFISLLIYFGFKVVKRV